MDQQTRTDIHDSRDRLAKDMRTVVDDAEQLLRVGAQGTGEVVAEARGKLQQSLASAKAAIVRLERGAVDRAQAAGRATDSYVRENPWQAIAAGAAVGALLGLLLARRK